ncbi:MAG: DUF885 domain-containing protein [Calditrichaeota bacterium]|nr:DUF885 domain-containing protein [Calditrichota bacterium]
MFTQLYSQANLPALHLSYVENLKSIPDISRIKSNLTKFENFKNELDAVAEIKSIDLEIIHYEVNLAISQLTLELQQQKLDEDIPENGVINLKLAAEWYRFWVQKWTGVSMAIAEIQAYGQSEVDRIVSEMNSIKKQTNEDLSDHKFLLSDPNSIENLFRSKRAIVAEKLFEIFPEFDLPQVDIERGTNQRMAQAPGYYSSDVFYFNLFEKPFNKRSADWLFIHESNPGHHYQRSYESQLNLPDYRRYFFNSGYKEGWAAYVESYGKEIGLYANPMDYFGWLEWDLIRSIRIVLDPAINYLGWSDEQAMAYWRRYITDQDDIAKREIQRMKNWPVQVLTYKLGSKLFRELKDKLLRKNPRMTLAQLHQKFLENGSIPMDVLYSHLSE